MDVTQMPGSGLGNLPLLSDAKSRSISAENPDGAKGGGANLREVLKRARGCRVELIMKDISTVRYEPQRLREWETIAMDVLEESAP